MRRKLIEENGETLILNWYARLKFVSFEKLFLGYQSKKIPTRTCRKLNVPIITRKFNANLTFHFRLLNGL